MPRCRDHHGLTLVELLIGLALLAILLSMAVPGFQAQIAAMQLSAATNALTASLMEARSQAMRLGQRVTICRSNDQQTCDTDATRGWESGWVIFVDAVRAGNNSAQVSRGDRILSSSPALTANLRIRGNQFVDDFVSFAATGQPRPMQGAQIQPGTIRVCNRSATLADTERARDLAFNGMGRMVAVPANVDSSCPRP